MDSVFECKLCLFIFDELSHKPLSLPCGHVLCQDCLSKQGKDFLICPIDKFCFDVSLGSLPCCYAILANLPKLAQKDSCCIRHPKKKVKFVCKSHDKFLCTECIIDHTGSGHNISAFTVNTAVVKSELKELENICETTIKENENIWKDAETRQKTVKDFYHTQINKINAAYENSLKTLLQRKKEIIGLFSKYLADQCKSIEKHKETIARTLENTSKVFHQLKVLQNNLPHYESLCLTIKSLKQELKYLETPTDPVKLHYFGFKATEPFIITNGNLEDIDEVFEIENSQKNKNKTCSHSSKGVLQNSCLNDLGNNLKISSFKPQDKATSKPDDKNVENKSPEKNEKYLKCRQNIHSRNHPKRMPWKKRNKSL